MIITRIAYDRTTSEVTFWFDGSPEPFSVEEFAEGTVTRKTLEAVAGFLGTANTVLSGQR